MYSIYLPRPFIIFVHDLQQVSSMGFSPEYPYFFYPRYRALFRSKARAKVCVKLWTRELNLVEERFVNFYSRKFSRCFFFSGSFFSFWKLGDSGEEKNTLRRKLLKTYAIGKFFYKCWKKNPTMGHVFRRVILTVSTIVLAIFWYLRAMLRRDVYFVYSFCKVLPGL